MKRAILFALFLTTTSIGSSSILLATSTPLASAREIGAADFASHITGNPYLTEMCTLPILPLESSTPLLFPARCLRLQAVEFATFTPDFAVLLGKLSSGTVFLQFSTTAGTFYWTMRRRSPTLLNIAPRTDQDLLIYTLNGKRYQSVSIESDTDGNPTSTILQEEETASGVLQGELTADKIAAIVADPTRCPFLAALFISLKPAAQLLLGKV